MKKPTSETERRAERLAAALRANLGRRKQQARGRKTSDMDKTSDSQEPAPEPEAAGDAQMPQERKA